MYSDWANLLLYTEFTFRCPRLIVNGYINCVGPYIYSEHNSTGKIAGFWSTRTGVGGTILQSTTSWSCMGGYECSTNGVISNAHFNAGEVVK